MSDRLIEVPLALELTLRGKGDRLVSVRHAYHSLPCQPVARQLAEAHLASVNTGGGIKSPTTSTGAFNATRRFLRFLDGRGFSGDLRTLDRQTLREFSHGGTTAYDYGLKVRALIRRYAELHPGQLQRETVELVEGAGAWGIRPPSQAIPVPSLSEGEAQRLTAACKTATLEIERRRQESEESVLAYGDRPPDLSQPEGFLAAIARFGPMSESETRARFGVSSYSLSYRRQGLIRSLYPSASDLLPFLLLLGLGTGISPEGYSTLRLDDIEQIGGESVRLHWYKARAVGRESDVFRATGQWSVGGLLKRVIALTGYSRAQTAIENKQDLWLRYGHVGPRLQAVSHWTPVVKAWVRGHGLTDDQGTALHLDLRRLRKTYLSRMERRTGGSINLTAGINQSAQVAADHYLTPRHETDLHSRVIERTMAQMVDRAERSTITVISETELPELARDPGRAAERLGVSEERASALLNTEQEDVFAGKCADFYDSPHATKGEPCPAPIWECLFCRQCVITPTKLPNLLRLLDHIDSKAPGLTITEFEGRFGAARRVITERILPEFSDAVVSAARQRVTETKVALPIEERQ